MAAYRCVGFLSESKVVRPMELETGLKFVYVFTGGVHAAVH